MWPASFPVKREMAFLVSHGRGAHPASGEVKNHLFLKSFCQTTATSTPSLPYHGNEQKPHTLVQRPHWNFVLSTASTLHCPTVLPLLCSYSPTSCKSEHHGVDVNRLNKCSSDQEPHKQRSHHIRTCQECHASCMPRSLPTHARPTAIPHSSSPSPLHGDT